MTYFIYHHAKQLKLDKFLKNNFEDWKEILDLAAFILINKSVMQYVPYFQANNFRVGKKLDSPAISRLFEKINNHSIQNFFKQWSKERKNEEYLAYDITRICSYSMNIDELEYGYNNESKNLEQINVGMLVGEKSGIPVAYEYYSGSIPDSVKIVDMLSEAIKLDLQSLTFVMDRGFETKKNRLLMDDKNFKYVMPISNSRLDVQNLISEQSEFINSYNNRCGQLSNGSFIHGKAFKIDDSKTIYHLFFSDEKKMTDRIKLYKSIEEMKEQLTNFNRQKRIPQRYKDVFNIVLSNADSHELEWVLDDIKVKNEIFKLGYFVLITNRADLTSSEVLDIYSGRSKVENVFDSLKNELGFDRLPVHKSSTLHGKLFVGFISLIFRSILERVKKHSSLKKQSCEQILKSLLSISITSSGEVKQLSKQQREVCEILEIDGILGNKTIF